MNACSEYPHLIHTYTYELEEYIRSHTSSNDDRVVYMYTYVLRFGYVHVAVSFVTRITLANTSIGGGTGLQWRSRQLPEGEDTVIGGTSLLT